MRRLEVNWDDGRSGRYLTAGNGASCSDRTPIADPLDLFTVTRSAEVVEAAMQDADEVVPDGAKGGVRVPPVAPGDCRIGCEHLVMLRVGPKSPSDRQGGREPGRLGQNRSGDPRTAVGRGSATSYEAPLCITVNLRGPLRSAQMGRSVAPSFVFTLVG